MQPAVVLNPRSCAATDPVRLGVGGLVMEARVHPSVGLPAALEPHFEPFRTDRPATLSLLFRRGSFPSGDARLVFESGGVWRLYALPDGSLRYDLSDPVFGAAPYAQARVDRHGRTGEVRLRVLEGHVHGGRLYPFVYPLDEVLAVSLLAAVEGFHVHAAGIATPKGGLLLPGVSGAGKSTVSRLFSGRGDCTVLSDDRVVVRAEPSGPTLHGTPWHGEAEMSSPAQAPLRAVLFLQQSRSNRLEPLPPSRAAAELLARSFPPYWDAAGLERSLAGIQRVAESVPSYRLHFRPEPGAVEAAMEALS